MKSTSLLLAAAAAAVGLAALTDNASAAVHETHQRLPANRSFVPVMPSGSSVVLHDQLGTASGNGALSAAFTSAGGNIYDSEGADDFVVPAEGWSITQVSFGAFPGIEAVAPFPTIANVRVYNSAGSVPATTTACSYNSLSVSFDDSASLATIALPTPCDLTTPGTYWITFQPIYDFNASGGDYYWLNSTPQVGSSGYWRNPGDGLETGCVAWAPNGACGFDDPDYTFQLVGRVLPVSLQSFGID